MLRKRIMMLLIGGMLLFPNLATAAPEDDCVTCFAKLGGNQLCVTCLENLHWTKSYCMSKDPQIYFVGKVSSECRQVVKDDAETCSDRAWDARMTVQNICKKAGQEKE
jgi:hypothetical protein